jgi:predicted MFS family arabinose efflux permease
MHASFSAGLIVFPTVGGFLAEHLGFSPVLIGAAVFYAFATILVLAVREQPRSPATSGLGFQDAFSDRRVVTICVISVFVFMAMFLGQPFAPNYLEEVVGLELAWIGFLGSSAALGATVLGIGLGRLSEGVAGLVLGQGLVLVSLVMLLNTQAIPLLALSFFLRGAYNASRALILGQMGKVISESASGLVYGLLDTAVGLPWVIAPYTAAWLYTIRPDLPFIYSAGMTAVMMVVSAVLLRGLAVRESSP